MAFAFHRWCGLGAINAVLMLLVAGSLLWPGLALAGDFSMILESNVDQNAGQEIFEVGFQTVDDILANIQMRAGFTQVNCSATYSIRGHAYGGGRHHFLYESDSDMGGGAELFIASFPSVADIYANRWPDGDYTAGNVNSNWSVGGFAYDGSQYHILLEHNDDAPGGGEVYIMSYDSLADVYSNTQASASYSQMDITSTFSIAGFTFDGGHYYLVYETDDDAGAGDEVWVSTFDSFAEVLSGSFGVLQASQMNISSSFSIAGFAGRVPIFEDGFDWGWAGDWSQ